MEKSYSVVVPSKNISSIQYPLKGVDINETCKKCHDGGGQAPDVFESDTGYNIPENGREAGALNNVSSYGEYAPYKGHTLGDTSVAPLGTWSNPQGLNCADCHDPHGNTNGAVDIKGNPIENVYRNLNTNAGNAPDGSINVSYAIGPANDITKDIFEKLKEGNNKYDISNIDFNKPDNTKSAITEFCKKCHSNILGNSNGNGLSGRFTMHPAAGINIGEASGKSSDEHSTKTIFGNKSYRVKVMSDSGDWGTHRSKWISISGSLTPTCLSCHKAHGNRNSFGLIYAKGTANLGEDGDGKSVTDLCHQCHK